MRVTSTINQAVFELQRLADNQKKVAHAQPLIPYPSRHSNEPETQRIVKKAEHLKQVYHAVERLMISGKQRTGTSYAPNGGDGRKARIHENL